MDPFVFKYPPPPPPPRNYPAKPPPPPPPPSTTTEIPAVTQTPQWFSNFDFHRPPPVVNNPSQYRGKDDRNHFNQNNFQYGINSVNYGAGNFKQQQQQYPQKRYNNWTSNRRRNFNNKQQRLDSPSSSASNYNNNVENVNRTSRSSSGTNWQAEETDGETNHDEVHRGKKRKKPLSQAIPAKRAWTDEEAQMAINVEKEFNKLFKNHSLKIKFPDQELNREIVSKFHSSIETVYFQQPSNPRFCFVTLSEGVDPNKVIEELNKIKFGLGHLSAEYKKDREEDQNVGHEDIDPLTLYVGNLAQDVTKEDMVNFYPKNKRIDIGYAKKMKFTRYAFVTFRNVHDAIEAFKATHYADLHSKSIIVRFRRLHGTVGMPGEPKVQNTFKKNQDGNKNETATTHQTSKETETSGGQMDESLNDSQNFNDDIDKTLDESLNESQSFRDKIDKTLDEWLNEPSFNEEIDKSCEVEKITENSPQNCSISNNVFDPSLVKSEPNDYSDDSEPEENLLGNLDPEITVKKESIFDSTFDSEMSSFELEPGETNKPISNTSMELENIQLKKEIDNEPANPEDNEEEFNISTDFASALDNLSKRPKNVS